MSAAQKCIIATGGGMRCRSTAAENSPNAASIVASSALVEAADDDDDDDDEEETDAYTARGAEAAVDEAAADGDGDETEVVAAAVAAIVTPPTAVCNTRVTRSRVAVCSASRPTPASLVCEDTQNNKNNTKTKNRRNVTWQCK